MKISAFTFGYNLISGGFPVVQAVEAIRPYVDEVVAVDCQSTDDTKRILQAICHKVIDGPAWEGRDIQHQVFELHRQCEGDIIILFEADEVYSDSLLSEILWAIEKGWTDIGVYRIQVEQNLQRIRQYPIPVHRVFPKGKGSYHLHPTNCPDYVHVLPPSAGFLWDLSACFKDNIENRRQNQSKAWGEPRRLYVKEHLTESSETTEEEEDAIMNMPHWTWDATPLAIPDSVKCLLGKSKYEVNI